MYLLALDSPPAPNRNRRKGSRLHREDQRLCGSWNSRVCRNPCSHPYSTRCANVQTFRILLEVNACITCKYEVHMWPDPATCPSCNRLSSRFDFRTRSTAPEATGLTRPRVSVRDCCGGIHGNILLPWRLAKSAEPAESNLPSAVDGGWLCHAKPSPRGAQ